MAGDEDRIVGPFGDVGLADGVVSLRPATGDDAEDVFELLQDVEMLLLTGSASSRAHAEDVASGREQPWGTPKKLGEVYDEWAADEDRAVWMVVEQGRVRGEVLLMDLDRRNRSAGLRVWIGAEGRGRGLGTAALTLALDYAFRTAGLHRVSLEVYAHNPRARRLYERLGFRHEGTLRHALRQDGEWIDADAMGVLAQEWLAAR